MWETFWVSSWVNKWVNMWVAVRDVKWVWCGGQEWVEFAIAVGLVVDLGLGLVEGLGVGGVVDRLGVVVWVQTVSNTA
jgi:hypothetical protein